MNHRSGLTEWDCQRLKLARLWSRLLTVSMAGYLVLDTARMLFGVFEWSTNMLKSVVVGFLLLHGASIAAVFKVVSEHRAYGALGSYGMIVAATAPASLLGFVAFHIGVANPTAAVLPVCLGLITVATWGGASIAERSLEQNTSEPTPPF